MVLLYIHFLSHGALYSLELVWSSSDPAFTWKQ